MEAESKNPLLAPSPVDEEYMRLALAEAEAAAEIDEVPVGAVIVRRGEVIALAHNTRESDKCATAHAELRAIEAACRKAGGWRLTDSTLYVTLEPCPMCAGAILHARLDRVVYGAADPKGGALGSCLNLNEFPLNHKCAVTSGVLSGDCAGILSRYFKRKREEKKKENNR